MRSDFFRRPRPRRDVSRGGLLVLNAEQRIQCANARVRRCLHRHFQMPCWSRQLPDAVRGWLATDNHPFEPLVVRRGDRRLAIRVLYVDQDGATCLVVTETRAADADRLQMLSRREEEVMWRVASGESDKEIGNALGLSAGTVRKHLQHVFEKLGVNNRTAAVEAFKRGVAKAA